MSIAARKWIILSLAVVLTVTSTVLLNVNPAVQPGLPGYLAAVSGQESADNRSGDVSETSENEILQPVFSHSEHFYDSEISVSITASMTGAGIFYTLDGTEPTVGSARYTGPITIKLLDKNEINVVTIKAIAVSGDIITRPLVHTYFTGSKIFDRFDTLVFSLSTDPDHLYDYDTGIFVEGRTRTEYRRENPREKIEPPSPANFNWRGMEGERPVYAEVFESNGERVIAQAAGVRVHGGWSRASQQKSIRLIARNEYQPGQGKFHYDFFPDDTVKDGYDTPFGKYDQLILRNGANDRDFAMIRNEVGYRLAQMAGLQVVSPARPAAVFLNGEYYGFAWLQVRVNAQYLQDIFSAPTRHFQVVGMGEYWIDTDDPAERRAIEDLNGFYTKDLSNDAIFAEFEQLVDVDQLLLYYALQTYLGNQDWPHNNLKRWRYIGEQEDGFLPELDGRWRYVTFDLDWILGLYEDPPDADKPTFQDMMELENERYSHMLNALFVRSDMADKFAMIMCDIAANVVTGQNVNGLISELFGISRNEIRHALTAKKYAGWVSSDSILSNHFNMYKVTGERSAYIFRSLRDHFGWDDDMFTVEVTGAEAYIGTQKGFSANYFSHLKIPLRPALPEHTVFDHWVVNGSVINKPEIEVSLADAVDGVVKVELVTRVELPVLMFGEAYGSSAQNGCTLYNPGEEEVHTGGLYMSNDISNPFLWAIPDARVEPGGILELAGKGSKDIGDLHKIRMGFNARRGQRLYLSDETGTVITHILVSQDEIIFHN